MNRAATLALAPLSVLYGLAVRVRNAFYRRGILPTKTVGVPVISVGNLTTGGTGKTPLVAWIAREVCAAGFRVCVLSRGYGRKNSQHRVIASDGENVTADVTETGDEPYVLAEKLLGKAAVVCDADRVASAKWAIPNLSIDAFVLDDAFQHQGVTRQFNVLTIDAGNPWGNGWLLPAGILREPIAELARADCIVITRADTTGVEALRERIDQLGPDIPIFLSIMKQTEPQKINAEGPAGGVHDPSRVAAFCAIGNPAAFFTALREGGYDVVQASSFRDHYRYTQKDIDAIVHEAQAHGAEALFTTVKDAVKIRSLNFVLPCYVADIEIEIERAEMFRELILKAISTA
jgi:tetraacyldisaccharide 4'-kinase